MRFVKDLLKKRNNKERLAIYTAIFSRYDKLIEPRKERYCDYFLFTDDTSIKSEIFKVIYCEPSTDPNREAKKYKILPHKYLKGYKCSLWIDGSVKIIHKNIYRYAMKILKRYKIAFLKHPERRNIYEELEACIIRKKDDINIMKKQVENYRKSGYDEKSGLIAGTIIFRRHMDKEIIKLDEEWWDEIKKYSRRDQLSFNYVAWKNNVSFGLIDLYLWDNKYFKVIPHRKK